MREEAMEDRSAEEGRIEGVTAQPTASLKREAFIVTVENHAAMVEDLSLLADAIQAFEAQEFPIDEPTPEAVAAFRLEQSVPPAPTTVRSRGDGDAGAYIKQMVDRFLMWRLPEDFNPDGGITFNKTFNELTAYPMKHQPVGTNLLDAMQADAMVRYMLEGIAPVAWRIYDKTNDGYFVTHSKAVMHKYLGSAGFVVEGLFPLQVYDLQRHSSEGR